MSDETSAPHPRESRSGRLTAGADHDVFALLLDGATELGDVVHADPGSGIIQVVLGDGPATSALLIEIR
ncbi:MAG: hypothetical protein JRG86_11795 [Deltaproteobacteria bacterium]|nr:hypothetical protein [Deltaproteobacteria bacterium]